ncbi:MAG: GNAT family N-acetyltransferase [Christensenellaceae bacterium]|jgi:hypothetical protein
MDAKAVKAALVTHAKRQIAIDFACQPEDFDGPQNKVVVYRQHEKRRRFGKDAAEAFKIACFGGAAVLTAPSKLKIPLQKLVTDKQGIWLFEFSNLMALDKVLQKEGFSYGASHISYLPNPAWQPNERIEGKALRWFEQAEIEETLFQIKGLENALGYGKTADRPDVLAVAAYDGTQIMGVAGASRDTNEMWQIGIDVFPAYRARRLGAGLVLALKEEIIKRGAIPYYSTSMSNLYSQNIAYNTGFFPAWVEGYGEKDAK